MIRLNSLQLSFNEQVLFNSVSALVQPYEKLGLVGPNGAGKSTLLKVIAGAQKLDGGRIAIEGGMSIAYLPQEVVLTSPYSIFDEVMQAYGEVGAMHVRAQELEKSGAIACEEYAHIQAELAHAGYGAKCSDARRILCGLGFVAERQDDLVSTLSVGWQMRVVLAKLLLQDADFYLFDEPTNHLDLPSREWLCRFLRQSRSGYMLISHDRYVLDQVCDSTLVLGKGKLTEYSGNYSFYRKKYEESVVHLRAAKEQQDREIEQKKKTIERFRASANKSRMAKSMEKQLEKIERIEFDEEYAPEMALPFPPIERSGSIALKTNSISKSFGDKCIFTDASFEIPRGQRVAIVAPNGAGKTTLLSCLYGALKLDSGSVSFGHNVAYAVFEQEQVAALDMKATVLEEVEDAACKSMRARVRNVLGALLFSGDAVQKKIKVLSGGERNRVALAKVLVQQANMLILDEPTNHLDLLAKQVLARGLSEYQGTLLLVSHDRDVVETVATAILSIEDGVVTYFPGSYAEWLFAKEQKKVERVEQASVIQGAPSKKAPVQKDFPLIKKQLSKCEREVARLELAVAEQLEVLGVHEYGTDEYERILKKYEEKKQALEAATSEWEELYERVG